MKVKKDITILAIETSCDDTGIAILEASGFKKPFFKVLSNIVSSQVEIHRKYGGVYPTLAKREHQKNLVPVLIQALKESKLLKISKSKILISKQIPNSLNSAELQGAKRLVCNPQILNAILEREPMLLKKTLEFLKKYEKPDIDLIAVTNGPGLEPCLWVGVNFARALAYFWNIPIVPVNHIEAHIIANWLPPISSKSKIKVQKGTSSSQARAKIIFPAVCLVVSGGHTQLILMRGLGKYKIIGETRDDAAGECFDKTARILGLGYPGGPIISKLAVKALEGPTLQWLPRPMIHSKDYDFSFSGLKTAVLYAVRKKYSAKALLRSAFSRTTEGRQYIKQMCAEIQQAVIDVLIKKTIKAAKDYNAKTIILGGGVAANKELRKQFGYKLKTINYKLNLLVPPKDLCTDNALMVAIAGYFRWKQGKIEKWRDIEANANLRVE